MEGIAGWLAQTAWPLVSRVLAALGFGYVTYEGASAAVEGAISAAQSAAGGLVGEVAQILALAGFFDWMSITSGGIVSGLAWMAMKRFALVTTGNGGGAT